MSLLKAQRNDNKIVQCKNNLEISKISIDQYGYLKVSNIDEIKNDISIINTNINDISVDAEKIANNTASLINSQNLMITELKEIKTYMKEIRDIIISSYQTSTNRIRVTESKVL